jgi:pimeloyl-ACP methyl ester carboxylesterase
MSLRIVPKLRFMSCLLLACLSLAGCAFVRFTRDPMPMEVHAPLGPQRARGVIVLLPGFGDRASTFAKQGFLGVLERRAKDYDIVATDAHFGYYRKGTLVERLEHDIVGPLRAKGYREIWLAGTSMGGFGAVGYARTHPERVAGVLLFAPYMGKRKIIDEVKHAGGLCKWKQAKLDVVDDEESFARMNLRWLKEQTCSTPPGVPLWIGVGSEDGLFTANELLGKQLPPSHLLVLPGGHGWGVWTPALDTLAQRAFPTETAYAL